MSENGNIEFECIQNGCSEVIKFSLRQAERDSKIPCQACKNEYRLDQALVSKLKSFESLVQAVKSARDILGSTSVGVTVNDKTVKIWCAPHLPAFSLTCCRRHTDPAGDAPA